jgi:hypothetical protein
MFNNGGGNSVAIHGQTGVGVATSWVSTSDERLKKNISTIS